MSTARECRPIVTFFVNCSNPVEPVNWIWAVDQFRVKQLICCQKCWANDCRAFKFRAVHPHSFIWQRVMISVLIANLFFEPWCLLTTWFNIGITKMFVLLFHFKWLVDCFEDLDNPSNCQSVGVVWVRPLLFFRYVLTFWKNRFKTLNECEVLRQEAVILP